MCTLRKIAAASVCTSINNRDEQKNFRVSRSYSISNSYSISKWRAAAACFLCQRLHTPRTPLIPLYVPARTTRRVGGNPPAEAQRRAFSDAVRIKDPMFTRTWSSETTATHNARNNGGCTSISSAHPRTLVAPTGTWSFMQMIQTHSALWRRNKLVRGKTNVVFFNSTNGNLIFSNSHKF